MKIFVIEDEQVSIESARMQLEEAHQLTFFTTAMEVLKLLNLLATGHEKPDIILTDVNIPMGDPSYYSVKDHYSPSDMIPAGLIVALRAATLGVPCLIVTDSNSHRDMIGFLLDQAQLHCCPEGKSKIVETRTRPDRIETPFGMGKDWLSLTYREKGIEEAVKNLTTPRKSYKEIQAEMAKSSS